MGFKKDDDYNISELGNWNVAADYSRLKIMKPLYLSDSYENIAKFGYDNLLDQLENFNIPSEIIRLVGFERLVNELLRLIKNSKFAMKTKGTLETVQALEKKLEKIIEIIPALSKPITSSIKKTKTIKIDEVKYKKVLEIVLNIKSELNDPLNKNDLIFTDRQEFDPVKYKEEIFKQATTRG